MSSMEQHTGSMLMTWQEKKQRHTHRNSAQTRTAHSRDQEHVHACPCQHREVGAMDGDTAELQISPTSQPRV